MAAAASAPKGTETFFGPHRAEKRATPRPVNGSLPARPAAWSAVAGSTAGQASRGARAKFAATRAGPFSSEDQQRRQARRAGRPVSTETSSDLSQESPKNAAWGPSPAISIVGIGGVIAPVYRMIRAFDAGGAISPPYLGYRPSLSRVGRYRESLRPWPVDPRQDSTECA